MKTFTLILSDSASTNALNLAGNHGVPVESFLSAQIEDLLDSKGMAALPNLENEKPWPSPNKSASMPDTLFQVLQVCEYVYKSKVIPPIEIRAREQLIEALHAVAKKIGVTYSTVRDKCCTTRRLGLPGVSVNTDKFVDWLQTPESLRDHLCRKFPLFVEEIRKKFSVWLPERF